MDIEKIEKLNELKEKGVITEEEFRTAKARLLGSDAPARTTFESLNLDSKSYSMLMHFSQFCCFIVPVLGWVVPLVMWLTKKDDVFIDQQGRVIFNWIASSFIYAVICGILMFVIIGFFLFAALVICSIVFTVMGGINAKDGAIRSYPLSIRFLPVNEVAPPGLMP